MLTGARSDSAVTFVKSYEQPDIFHRSSVRYEGVLNGENTEIEGRWTIMRFWSGKFLMVRSPGKEVRASKRSFARI